MENKSGSRSFIEFYTTYLAQLLFLIVRSTSRQLFIFVRQFDHAFPLRLDERDFLLRILSELTFTPLLMLFPFPIAREIALATASWILRASRGLEFWAAILRWILRSRNQRHWGSSLGFAWISSNWVDGEVHTFGNLDWDWCSCRLLRLYVTHLHLHS